MTNRSSQRKRSKHEQQAAAAVDAAYPASVQLYIYGDAGEHDEDDAVSCSAAEAKTMAAARITAGRPIQAFFRFAPPPEASRLLVRFPDGAKRTDPFVIAAHGDSVLFQICFEEGYQDLTIDHFVYNVGVASGPNPRPPALSLLPPYCLSDEVVKKNYSLRQRRGPVHRSLFADATGLVRRGEDEFAVAELKMVVDPNDDDDKKVPELLLLRSGRWSVRRPKVISQDGSRRKLRLSKWETSKVFRLRDELLCWVDVYRGLLFSNVFDQRPGLRYVPLPVKPDYCSNVCVTAGGSTVKYVNIFRHCCCGGKRATDCLFSRHAFTIQTWMLRVDDDMAWVMDSMVDSTEIWALDAYKGLPRVPMFNPVVSGDDPHVISFEVCERDFVKRGDKTDWLITLDLRSNTLLSACHRRDGRYGYNFQRSVICTGISDYFNSNSHSSSSSKGSSSMIESHVSSLAPPAKKSRLNNEVSPLQSSCKMSVDPAMQVFEVLMVFQEIPSYGLAHDDTLKAYSILSHDNGRRFKTLLKLPMSLRKDWLLMEIKASEAKVHD